MSKPVYGPPIQQSDALTSFLEAAARLVMWAGIFTSLVCVGFLVWTYSIFAMGAPAGGASPDQALSNIEILQKLLLAGVISLGVGTTYLYWGEETLGAIQLIGAGALFFAPLYLPLVFAGGQASTEVGQRALGALQLSGTIAGIIAIGVTVSDIAQRAALRARQGARADQLRYGKGIKVEQDIRNVFLGKCWQLPFCRKFVRERCPIYHAKRTCWKERVGCMCEEQVIRDAMAGKVIPKDAVAASKFIPYNRTLSQFQKEERCRQCVIYNEHQKHKYKLVLPIAFIAFGGVYALFRAPMLQAMEALFETLDRMIGRATFTSGTSIAETASKTTLFQEILLLCLLVIALTYALKLIEFMIFKLKI